MLGGAIEETVFILRALKNSEQYGLYGLTNWSAETFPIALQKFDFFSLFDGIVVSGTEKLRKPNPAFYQLLLHRYNLIAQDCLLKHYRQSWQLAYNITIFPNALPTR